MAQDSIREEVHLAPGNLLHDEDNLDRHTQRHAKSSSSKT